MDIFLILGEAPSDEIEHEWLKFIDNDQKSKEKPLKYLVTFKQINLF